MASLILKGKLALELVPINQALALAVQKLPKATQSIARHILDAGGKRLRPFLTVMTARLCGYSQDDVYKLAISLEMLHAATLLHDDIIDQATVRRGKPAAHTIFPINATILAGDALLAQGNALVAEFANPDLSACFSKATIETCAGEIEEIQSQYNPDLTAATYIDIIKGKTAKLISCACEMGALLAKANPKDIAACANFGENVGIAFQLVDDAIDFDPTEITGKPCGGDLREGKLTLPLRLYQDSLDTVSKNTFAQAFRNQDFSEAEVQKIIKTIQAQGFNEQTRERANTYLNAATKSLETLPNSSEKNILLAMAEFVRTRTK